MLWRASGTSRKLEMPGSNRWAWHGNTVDPVARRLDWELESMVRRRGRRTLVTSWGRHWGKGGVTVDDCIAEEKKQ